MAQARINFTPPTTRGSNTAPLAAADIAAYKVERIPNAGGVWSLHSTVPNGTPIVVDVNPGDAHQYRLSTVDTGGRVGPPSAPIEIRYDAIPVIPTPDWPTNLSVTYL